MKSIQLLLVLIVFSLSPIYAQKTYFQQSVDYKIEVSLDDKSHILRAYERLEYVNNSPDTLRFIFMHLWPNAYKNDRTAFTAHQVENKEKYFYFSKENDKGFIDSLDFKINGENVNVSNYNNHQDIVMIELNQPLLPGGKLILTTPFRVVVPEVFSRLGHDNQNYQITQWYPKPAVYDKYGWHPMPYLDQGEFYSEFGNFEVKITVPKNYVIAATGDLQEQEEIEWINLLSAQADSNTKPKENLVESSSMFKTISFKQSNVHDFAWFASKYFGVEKSIATLSSGTKVECFSYFLPQNKNIYKESSKVTASTIEFLSKHVGEYPYRHASVVDGKLLAGGGMEYPNVTIIGSMGSKELLQTVIIHEVGHNWFYGILGSNERQHPWLDEGVNSFYEHKLDKLLSQHTILDKTKKLGLDLTKQVNGVFLYNFYANQNLDQPIDLPAPEYSKLNYGGVVYTKAAMMMAYLESYLGEEVFESIMKKYFNEWKFKHPYPIDFEQLFVAESKKNLDWFFKDGLNSTQKIDFKYLGKKVSGNVALVYATSCTDFKGPIPISAYRGDSLVDTKWLEYPYQTPVSFSNYDSHFHFKIDGQEILPESRISNNQKPAALLGLKLSFVSGIGIKERNKIFILPSIGYNFYNKFMLGGVLHNFRLPNHKFQFALAPMYSFGTSSLVGSGIIGYSFYPSKVFHKVTLGLGVRSYHYDASNLNISKPVYARYTKWNPSLRIDLNNSIARSPISKQILLEYIGIQNETFKYAMSVSDSLYRPTITSIPFEQYGRASYFYRNTRTFHPYSYKLMVEANQQYLKTTFNANLRIDYHLKNKAFYARVFAGKFLGFSNSNSVLQLRSKYLSSTSSASNDYLYDNIYIARSEPTGLLSQQIAINEGGFKIKTNQYASPIGMSNNWLAAVNLRSDLPIKLPVKIQLFLDAGTFANAGKLNPSGNKLLFDAGIELHLLGDVFTLYAPLFMSKDFKDYTKTIYGKNRILNTMTFSLNLAGINFLNTNYVSKFVGF